MTQDSAERKNSWDIYSYKGLDGRVGYMAISQDVGRSISRSLRKRLELKAVASYREFSTSKKLPNLRAVMHHQGNESDLKSKIEKIIEE